jgi:hypothetical protein
VVENGKLRVNGRLRSHQNASFFLQTDDMLTDSDDTTYPENDQMKSTFKAPEEVETLFGKLMTALNENSYDALVAEGDSNFQAYLRPQMVNGVSAQLAPRIAVGFESSYMGVLDRVTYLSYYWKLTFGDTQDDLLARLSIKDGKVHAFYIT